MTGVVGTLDGNGQYIVKNSTKFIANVAGMEISPEEVMVCFDVEALYMSLPKDRVLTHTRTRLEEDKTLDAQTCLNIEEIHHLLEYCLLSTFSSFQREFCHLTYRSRKGITDLVSRGESVHGRNRKKKRSATLSRKTSPVDRGAGTCKT